MGKIAVVENVFEEDRLPVIPHDGPLIDFLQARWPNGFNGHHVRVFFNDKDLAVEDYDTVVGADDIVTILIVPADPVTTTVLVAGLKTVGAYLVSTQVLTQIALTLVAAIITRLFMPRPKARSAVKAAYQIGGAQNQLALGDVVPEHFGTCWFYPSYASQPYSQFIKGDMYLYQIMLVGTGSHVLDELRVGSSLADAFPAGIIDYWWFLPTDHNSQLGYIQSVTGVHEDVVTSLEVQDIDFNRESNTSFFGRAYATYNYYEGKEANAELKVGDTVRVLGDVPTRKNHNVVSTITDITTSKIRLAAAVLNDGGNPRYQLVRDDDGWRGWFEVCAPTKRTDKLELDFVFPNGIYKTDDEGDYRKNAAFIHVEVQAIDDFGTPQGSAVLYKYSYEGSNANPKRITETISVAPGRYRVRAKRDDQDDPKSNNMSRCAWTALRAFCVNAAGAFAYGDVTLLVMKMKATRALSEAAAAKITCKATRVLPTVISNFNTSAPTKNPVDAFAYVVRSGADAAEGLDMGNLQTLSSKWAATNGFNFRFEDQSTVYEALQLIASGHRATPIAYAKQIGMRLDREQTFDKFLVTHQQMLEGSYSVGFKLGDDSTTDSYRVEYADPLSPSMLYVIWPYGGAVPEAVSLYGCTDKATALEHAKYLWAKRATTRRIAEFTTEFDAHCFSVGDRIAVMHPLVEWTSNARVLEVSGLVLTLDGLPETQGDVRVKLRSDKGMPSPLIDGFIEGNKLVLSAAPPFPIYTPFDGIEGTTVVMGVDANFRRSYIVRELNPSDSGVGVKVVGYDGAEYAFPIPGELA